MKLNSVRDYRRAVEGLADMLKAKMPHRPLIFTCHRNRDYTEFSSRPFPKDRRVDCHSGYNIFCHKLFPKIVGRKECPCNVYPAKEIRTILHREIHLWEQSHDMYLAYCMKPTPTMTKGKFYVVTPLAPAVYGYEMRVRNDFGKSIYIKSDRMVRIAWWEWRI